VLLNGGRLAWVLLYICSNRHGREPLQLQVPLLAPMEKFHHRVGVCRPRIFISDIGGEEFNEPPSGLLAGTDNRRRKPVDASAAELVRGDWDKVVRHVVACSFSIAADKLGINLAVQVFVRSGREEWAPRSQTCRTRPARSLPRRPRVAPLGNVCATEVRIYAPCLSTVSRPEKQQTKQSRP
jgi:hypothetical protein